jgi:hypothetical protein
LERKKETFTKYSIVTGMGAGILTSKASRVRLAEPNFNKANA